MYLQEYSSFFRPEEFDALTAAYDAAWQHLRSNKHAYCGPGSRPKEEPSANHSGVCLQRKTGRGTIERDCVARSLRARRRTSAKLACCPSRKGIDLARVAEKGNVA
jgi:hypothetical protein